MDSDTKWSSNMWIPIQDGTRIIWIPILNGARIMWIRIQNGATCSSRTGVREIKLYTFQSASLAESGTARSCVKLLCCVLRGVGGGSCPFHSSAPCENKNLKFFGLNP